MKLSKRFITFLLIGMLSLVLMGCPEPQTTEQTWEDPNPSVYQGEDDEWIDIDIDFGGSKRKTRMKRGDYKAGKQNQPSFKNTISTSTPKTVTRSTSSSSTTSRPSSSSSTTKSSSSSSRSTSSSSSSSRRK